jgi:SOS-response transcriptional repressor LexA
VNAPAPGADFDGGCAGGEVFALRVVGRSMMPEFADGDVIVVEPDGALKDGSFVVAQHDGEWIFRQLCAAPGAGWRLHALDPAWPDLPLADLDAVRGVVIQKAVPGRRRLTKNYV